ncbi:MAG: hypothetical protein P1P88_13865 [Bacteroidales bacterium]|nr:hypothetical protein [Bacteroidales bacterium]
MKAQSILRRLSVILIFLFSATYINAQDLFERPENDPFFSKMESDDISDSVKIALEFMQKTEERADEPAKKILATGRKLALEDSTIIPGTCWTYVNAIYKQAGYDKEKRHVFKSKKKGPYADTDIIKPGDWLYFINHSYHNIDHSAVFVGWLDKENKLGLTLSYTGRYKKKPGQYKVYNLKDVFFITRAGEKEEDLKLQANK